MASGSVSAASAHRAGDEVVRSAPFEWLARAGFVARGLIYAIIGVLALKLAIGDGGKTTNQQGALRTIAHQPFGKLLMILVAIGLGGYALWRLDPCSSRLRAGKLGQRLRPSRGSWEWRCLRRSLRARGRLLTGSSGSSSTSSSPHKAAAGVLGWPGGVWLVGGAGVVMIGVALFQGYRGLSRDFLDDSKTEQMSFADEAHDRADRGDRASRAHGRLRAHRRVSRQGCGRLQPEDGGRSGWRSRKTGPAELWPRSPRHRCRRSDRVRALLAQ